MKSNITLIGMPGAGKSTVGILLAKELGLGFVDTDLLIQTREGQTLQALVDSRGHMALRTIEEDVICGFTAQKTVIATGGSAVYSDRAMAHLENLSHIVFLELDFDAIRARIRNFDSRGIAMAPGQSFEELFAERQVLYRRWAEMTVACSGFNQEELAQKIADLCVKRGINFEDN